MTPSKIGFITSLLLHSLIIITILITKDDIFNKILIKNGNKIAISLENIDNKIENKPIKKQKKQERKKEKRKVIKETYSKQTQEVNEIYNNINEDIQDNNKQDEKDMNASGMAQELNANSELYAEILNIINKNNSYPREAYRRRITGSVELQFVLRNNGEIEDIKILNNIHKSLSKGAIDAINNSYKQFPSVKNNLRIKVRLTYNLI